MALVWRTKSSERQASSCKLDKLQAVGYNGIRKKRRNKMSKKENKSQINQLTDLYNEWGEKNNIKDLTSADEVILREGLSDNQRKWLEEFIESWDMAVEVDRYIYVQNKKKR
jgi:hypothetical protein